MSDILRVVMCGGAGERLWPLSNAQTPKPFLQIGSGASLFQQTCGRAAAIAPSGPIWAITDQRFAFCLLDQCGDLSDIHMLLEPVARNTAYTVLLSAQMAFQKFGPDQLMLFMPSDHVIEDVAGFASTIAHAKRALDPDAIMLFGIRPHRALNGYGYIEVDDGRVVGFHEKPDAGTAFAYLHSGRHFWNSGYVLARAGTILAQARRRQPEISNVVLNASFVSSEMFGTPVTRIVSDALANVDPISFDTAILEKSEKLQCIAAQFDWQDVGTFGHSKLLHRFSKSSKVARSNSPNCDVISSDRPIVLRNASDLRVVDSPEGLLIEGKTAPIESAQNPGLEPESG